MPAGQRKLLELVKYVILLGGPADLQSRRPSIVQVTINGAAAGPNGHGWRWSPSRRCGCSSPGVAEICAPTSVPSNRRRDGGHGRGRAHLEPVASEDAKAWCDELGVCVGMSTVTPSLPSRQAAPACPWKSWVSCLASSSTSTPSAASTCLQCLNLDRLFPSRQLTPCTSRK